MEEKDKILERIALLRPASVLDLGCGCGSFTTRLSSYCGEVTAIDSSPALIARCRRENPRPNISYQCLDGTNLRFPDNNFDLVLERMTLHHIFKWDKALDEMIRVSSKHILVEEPIDDPRSEEKRNTMHAQELFLAVQKEVGFSHYRYIRLDSLTGYFRKRSIPIESEIIRSDEPVGFDRFFNSFGDFAEKSSRKEYWFGRLESLREELNGKKLCEEDIVFIAALKL